MFGKECPIGLVHAGKICGICEQHLDVNNVVPARTRSFENGVAVDQGLARLVLDSSARHLAGRWIDACDAGKINRRSNPDCMAEQRRRGQS